MILIFFFSPGVPVAYFRAEYWKTNANILAMSVKVNFLFIVSATKCLIYIKSMFLTSRQPQISPMCKPANPLEFVLFSKEFQWSQF